jgi:hypothetical protein
MIVLCIIISYFYILNSSEVILFDVIIKQYDYSVIEIKIVGLSLELQERNPIRPML